MIISIFDIFKHGTKKTSPFFEIRVIYLSSLKLWIMSVWMRNKNKNTNLLDIHSLISNEFHHQETSSVSPSEHFTRYRSNVFI